MPDKIIGFSKLSRVDKINWISKNFLNNSNEFENLLNKYLNDDNKIQSLHNSFSENSISNFYLPYSVSPNFLINNNNYCIPLVTEESSVVAALANSSKFWYDRGGFKSKVLLNTKSGQIHFKYNGNIEDLQEFVNKNEDELIKSTDKLTKRMKQRGGGIKKIELINMSKKLVSYFQLNVSFLTIDSMGANFINSCLEKISKTFQELINNSDQFKESEKKIEIIMSILSNYTPECIVESSVECKIDELGSVGKMSSNEFAIKFKTAFDIANIDINRAVTHNKGIMNGIDAVLISTGNDFRAVEAGIHAFASRTGNYKSLSECSIIDNIFRIKLKIPLSIGTVGGITDIHPMVKLSLKLLKNPTSNDLMNIICSVGLAQNYAAVKSLVTTGIQKGHMKMHLINILNKQNATQDQINKAEEYLDDIQLFFCDGNRFGNSYLGITKKFFKKNVLIDDQGLHKRDQAEIVWNPNIYASSSLYSNWENIKLFIGEKYVLLRKEFERPINHIKKKSIFVSLGIAASDKIISIIDYLAKEYEFSVILSNDFSVDEMIDAIDNSLLTICGASVTLHEVWRRNTIALPVYQVKDQFHFKQFLIQNRIDYVNILDENEIQIKNNFNKLFNKYFNQEPFSYNNHIKMANVKNNSKLVISELYS